MDCKNYRGISLLNTSYKVLYAKEIVEEYQARFTAGKSTINQIHVIKQITENSHEFNNDVYLLFVYFKQANDSVLTYLLYIKKVQ